MKSGQDIARFADQLRLDALKMVAPHGFGYLGQVLSSAELFAALYVNYYRPAKALPFRRDWFDSSD